MRSCTTLAWHPSRGADRSADPPYHSGIIRDSEGLLSFPIGVPELECPGNLVRAMAVGWHHSAPAFLDMKLIPIAIASHTQSVVAGNNLNSSKDPTVRADRTRDFGDRLREIVRRIDLQGFPS